MRPTKKKEKLVPTVESVRSAIGQTWFDVTDEDDRIDIETRDHGDVSRETPGKEDLVEGRRILKALRKVFRQTTWVTKFDAVDEWVSVSVRKEPLSPKEKAEIQRKANIAKLRERVTEALAAANARLAKEGCRQPFSGLVYEGCYAATVSLKVVFGERLLYREHLGAGFGLANEEEAQAAIEPLVAGFPDLKWTRTVRAPSPRRTGNRPPPHNIIENEGCIEFECML